MQINSSGYSFVSMYQSYPSYCKNVDFNYETLSPIINDLNKHWHSKDEKNELFWKHEWEKHGSCMFNKYNEFQYFKKALELYISAVEADVINKYKVNDNKSMVPFDLNFNIIYNTRPIFE